MKKTVSLTKLGALAIQAALRAREGKIGDAQRQANEALELFLKDLTEIVAEHDETLGPNAIVNFDPKTKTPISVEWEVKEAVVPTAPN